MITAELTTRKIKSLKVEILRKNDYLDIPRFDVRALDGEPFMDRNSEGHFIPTAYATVLRSQLDNIQRVGVVNQHPAEISAALDEAKSSQMIDRVERFSAFERAHRWQNGDGNQEATDAGTSPPPYWPAKSSPTSSSTPRPGSALRPGRDRAG